jgi:uncharacterized peroxidase-related enzyme
MAFISTIPPEAATGEVLAMYRRQQGKYGFVPNYAKVFSHRPEIMQLWADLQIGIQRHMDRRRFELVTVAAALAIRSSYCSLAHGNALTAFFEADEVRAIVANSDDMPLTAAEKAMMDYARKVARNATSVTAEDTESLRAHGFGDAEIFDITAAATARTFFAQLCEGLGATPDVAYRDIDEQLRTALTVGRPIDDSAAEKVD